jgi:hypothetical protein
MVQRSSRIAHLGHEPAGPLCCCASTGANQDCLRAISVAMVGRPRQVLESFVVKGEQLVGV